MTIAPAALQITLLGELTVHRGDVVVPLPASRKTRALLAYLVLSGRPVRREHLCELLWELPDDPRGALRWSLSKLRAVLDDVRCKRLVADRDQIGLVEGSVDTDIVKAERLLESDGAGLEVAAALSDLRSPLLEGLELSHSSAFDAWLTARRADAERLRCRLLRHRVKAAGLSVEERLQYCVEWVGCEPFDAEAAVCLFNALHEAKRHEEADTEARAFEVRIAGEGLQATRDFHAKLARESNRGLPSLEAERQKIRFCRADDGLQIAYACVGSGPPLVKAANWLNHLELDWHAPIWAPLFHELARDHCFIRYDERGNGLSEGQVNDISFEAFVGDLEAVVDAAGIDRFPLLGLSQGCAVAIEYAARHPERVSHLILWGGYAAGWRIDASPELVAEREAIITLVRSGWGRESAVYRQMFSADFLPGATPAELAWFNDFQGQTVSAVNAARFLEVFADIDVRHRLPDLDVPTLVMHARGDRRIPLASGSRLAAMIPGAEFVTFASDNHLLLGREPASGLFVAHIRQFLESRYSSSSLYKPT